MQSVTVIPRSQIRTQTRSRCTHLAIKSQVTPRNRHHSEGLRWSVVLIQISNTLLRPRTFTVPSITPGVVRHREFMAFSQAVVKQEEDFRTFLPVTKIANSPPPVKSSRTVRPGKGLFPPAVRITRNLITQKVAQEPASAPCSHLCKRRNRRLQREPLRFKLGSSQDSPSNSYAPPSQTSPELYGLSLTRTHARTRMRTPPPASGGRGPKPSVTRGTR